MSVPPRLVSFALFVGAAAAQAPAPVLLGNRLLDGADGKELATLPSGTITWPQWRPDGTVHHAAGLVDPARRRLLAADGLHLRLVAIGGDPVWQRPITDLQLEAEVLLPQAVLGNEVAVIPDHDGHLVGVALADGKKLWRSEADGHGELVQDGELVAALATHAGGRRLRAYALGNGAPAFDERAPKAAEFTAIGPHGIVAGGPGGAAVFARSGPRLFAVEAPVRAAVADASGFYLNLDTEVVAFDRAGKERWRLPADHTTFNDVRLALGPTGLIVLVRYSTVSDSGAVLTAHEPERGEVAWKRTLPDLGATHSKYWHDVAAVARDGELLVASHAPGGQWLAALDGKSGDVRFRIQHTK